MVPQSLMKWNASGNWFCLDSLADSTWPSSFRFEVKTILTNTRCECVGEKSTHSKDNLYKIGNEQGLKLKGLLRLLKISRTINSSAAYNNTHTCL